jgi:hypothetical protein
MDCCECWIPKWKTQPLAARALPLGRAREGRHLTLFFVWLLETVRTGENGLKRATYAFQSLSPDPLGGLRG